MKNQKTKIRKIHKEGYSILAFAGVVGAAIVAALWVWLPWLGWVSLFFFVLKMAFLTRFFRVPQRVKPAVDNSIIYSPADGEIVAVEEVIESEYFKEPRLKISVFMSVWNVHINWFPLSGKILYFKHHQGKFLVAWAEKSSEINERTTTVVDTGSHVVLFRQIAGFIARRIVNRTQAGDKVEQCTECGFIKFGSRMDVYLPLGSDPKVKIGDKVTGIQTILAKLKIDN